MSKNPETQIDPVSMWRSFAMSMYAGEPGLNDQSGLFDPTLNGSELVDALEHVSDLYGFVGRSYFIQATRAFTVPVEQDGLIAGYVEFDGLSAEGKLETYSVVDVKGDILNPRPTWRALCLAMGNVTVLSSSIALEPQEYIHVPILDV